MTIRPTPLNADIDSQRQQRRHLMLTAATLGVAPWLLSACASAAGSDSGRAVAGSPLSRPQAAGARRRAGPARGLPRRPGLPMATGRHAGRGGRFVQQPL